LKRNLVDDRVSWDDPDIAPDPAKELEELSRTIRLARQARAEASKKNPPDANLDETPMWIQGFQAQQVEAAASTNGNAGGRVPRVAYTSRAAARKPPPPPGSNENTNPNSNQNDVTPEEECDHEEDGESYTGLGSTDEKRAEEAAKTAVKASSHGGKKKRKMGTWGSQFHHHVDSVSEETTKQAHIAVAIANKTLHVPGRTPGQPRRKLLLVELNECNENKAYGGRLTEAKLQRKKHLVVLVGASSDADVSYVWNLLLDALKHEKSKKHDLVDLNDPHFDFVGPTHLYFDARAKARSQPSTTPVPLGQIRDERHRRNSL
jgi:hypothetical protein